MYNKHSYKLFLKWAKKLFRTMLFHKETHRGLSLNFLSTKVLLKIYFGFVVRLNKKVVRCVHTLYFSVGFFFRETPFELKVSQSSYTTTSITSLPVERFRTLLNFGLCCDKRAIDDLDPSEAFKETSSPKSATKFDLSR